MSILTATDFRIEPREQRVWAALAHLSGLCTYLVPLGGIIAPILLILAKDSDPIVRSIAKQALYLNVAALLMVIPITVMAITIIGIPFGIQSFKIGIATLAPFGKEVLPGPKSGSPLRVIFNVIWLIFFGWEIALNHLFWALVLGITIIGLPFAKQHLKLVPLAIFPFGNEFRHP